MHIRKYCSIIITIFIIQSSLIAQITFEKIRDSIYLISGTGGANMIASIGSDGALLVETNDPAVTDDIKNGVFKMAIAHEMSHYIRKVGGITEASSFPEVDPVLGGIDWAALLKKYPQGDEGAWKEEVRADLKSIQIEYDASGKLPKKSEVIAYGKMLGSVVDHAHPPAATRTAAMTAYINAIKSETSCSCCYLTTACVEVKGLPDNCEELTLLRRFRDEYLFNQPNGRELFDWYYDYSPDILEAIERSDTKSIVYEYIYEIISDCVRHIKLGDMDYVFEKYCQMVINLKDHFLPATDKVLAG